MPREGLLLIERGTMAGPISVSNIKPALPESVFPTYAVSLSP